MLNSIDSYFQAERAESLLFAAFGGTGDRNVALSAVALWRCHVEGPKGFRPEKIRARSLSTKSPVSSLP